MSTGTIFQLVVLIILLLLSAFFSSAETALTSVSRIRMRTLASGGVRRAENVLRILDDRNKMLSCILIGNNIVNIFAASLTATLAAAIFGSASVGVMTGILTLVIILFGEITPKSAAAANADRVSLAYSGIIRFLMTVMTPLILVVDFLAAGIMRLLRIRTDQGEPAVTESEIRTMVEVSHEEGETTGAQREMINNVYDFGDRKARDIMTARADVVCVSVDESRDAVMEIFRNEQFTRLPVYETERVHIVGLLNMKDVFLAEDKDSFSVKSLMYPPYYTFEAKRLSELLEEMQENSAALTVVLDEYGQASGILTVEDLIEELVGDIRDEYDDEEADLIRPLSNGKLLVEGNVKLVDLNDRTGLNLTSEDYDTIGGFMIDKLGRIARKGDLVKTQDGLELTAVRVARNRIEKVLIKGLPPAGLPRRSAKAP